MDFNKKNVVTLSVLCCAALIAGIGYGGYGMGGDSKAALVDANGNIIPGSVDPGCSMNDDCSDVMSVCINAKCVPLENARCYCSESKKITCVDASERARHTYCENGCKGNATEASCIQ